MRTLAVAALAVLAAAVPAAAMPLLQDVPPPVLTSPAVDPPIDWRESRAVGRPFAGRLVRGVQLPAEGVDFWTYDWGTRSSPNRAWRRWGTDRLVRTLLTVLREFRAANPGSARVGVADLSREHGGPFGRNFGGLGHSSHQNGLDVDILYPRRDRMELHPWTPRLIDRPLAQDLVDRFVEAGATHVFTGPRLGLRGPSGVVVALVNHDDHLHVRIP
ncbi:MAG TPA: penicillin-insensitive murein endopeptidase [Solirubrobacteraceae bacterium]|nr:penicillin-insensitive murein endopeptidase [Solirubrobacteraceae bacterium]